MSDYAKAQWVGSPNYSANRDGHNPNWTAQDPNTWLVLHTMVGSEAAARARFENASQQASSHYGVKLDGSVVQYVAERDAAWTNGTYSTNPGSNLDSITIEHEDDGAYNGPRTPALYEASAQLVADIHRRRGIPLIHRGAGGGVLRHRECATASTSCPDSLDIDRIIARAQQILNPPPPPPPPDTRPEWLRNLKPLASVKTLQLYADVQVLDLVTGATRGIVSKGTLLQVANETSVAGVAYWVTTFGATHGDGLKQSDVAAASIPPQQPTTNPAGSSTSSSSSSGAPSTPTTSPTSSTEQPPKPPSDLWPWLESLLAFLKRLFGVQ